VLGCWEGNGLLQLLTSLLLLGGFGVRIRDLRQLRCLTRHQHCSTSTRGSDRHRLSITPAGPPALPNCPTRQASFRFIDTRKVVWSRSVMYYLPWKKSRSIIYNFLFTRTANRRHARMHAILRRTWGSVVFFPAWAGRLTFSWGKKGKIDIIFVALSILLHAQVPSLCSSRAATFPAMPAPTTATCMQLLFRMVICPFRMVGSAWRRPSGPTSHGSWFPGVRMDLLWACWLER
jgi:hypothetical protein